MKTLAITFLLVINTIQISFAQNDNNKTLIEFNLSKEDGAAVLNWAVDKEVNTSYYIVERAEEGEKFEIISRLKAGSSTYKKTTYEFEDTTSYEGFYSYRITLVYMDGSRISTLSETMQETNLTQNLGN